MTDRQTDTKDRWERKTLGVYGRTKERKKYRRALKL